MKLGTVQGRIQKTIEVAGLWAGVIVLGVMSAMAIRPAHAQDNTLRIVVPYPPGGSSDRSARLLGEALRLKTGTPVVVENISGAGGRLGVQQVRRMPADTNVLVLVNPALMVVAPLVYRNNEYDVERDFQPISQISRYEFAAAVSTAVPVREFSHLVAWVKANPEKANMGVPATASLPHFFSLMVAQAAGVPSNVVGYRGSAPLLTDLIGGHLPVAIDSLDTLLPQHEGGKLRILGTSGEKRAVASIPTLKESGFNVVATGWNVLYAKSSMPADRAKRLAQDIREVMTQPALREQFLSAKAEPVASTQEQTAAMLKAFKAQWEPIIQKSGLKLD
jgi:tripartite-type tricarboxylate transporter receptor subunit TctC